MLLKLRNKGGVCFGYFFNPFAASGRDAAGVRERGPQITEDSLAVASS